MISLAGALAGAAVVVSGITALGLLWELKNLTYDRARERRVATLKGLRLGAYAILTLSASSLVAFHTVRAGLLELSSKEAADFSVLLLWSLTAVRGVLAQHSHQPTIAACAGACLNRRQPTLLALSPGGREWGALYAC